MSRAIANIHTSGITLASGDSPLTITDTGLISNDSSALYALDGSGRTWAITNAGTIIALTGGAGMMVADRSSLAPSTLASSTLASSTGAPRATDAPQANRAAAGAA
jgi:hypothetical protein